ncbi:MAG: hypothetical protein WC457_04055 [Patescibacteria group bacterium]
MNFQDHAGNQIHFLKGMRIYFVSEHPELLMVGMPRDHEKSDDSVYFSDGTNDNKLLFSDPLTYTSLRSIARLIAACVGCETEYFKRSTGLNGQFEVIGYRFV